MRFGDDDIDIAGCFCTSTIGTADCDLDFGIDGFGCVSDELTQLLDFVAGNPEL